MANSYTPTNYAYDFTDYAYEWGIASGTELNRIVVLLLQQYMRRRN